MKLFNTIRHRCPDEVGSISEEKKELADPMAKLPGDKKVLRKRIFLLSATVLVLLLAAILTIRKSAVAAAPLQPVVYEIIPTSFDGSFLLAEYSFDNMSLMASGDISHYTIRIYEDGLCEISLNLAIWNNSDAFNTALKAIDSQAHTAFTLSRQQIFDLTAFFEETDLEMLPPDVGWEGFDGYSSYLTVYLDKRRYCSGGYLANDERYNELVSQIWEYVGPEYSALSKKVRQQVVEAAEKFDVE